VLILTSNEMVQQKFWEPNL